jgi:hypothetical protein
MNMTIKGYILSNQWYNKLRYEPIKSMQKRRCGRTKSNVL